jgi:hypothetical protein
MIHQFVFGFGPLVTSKESDRTKFGLTSFRSIALVATKRCVGLGFIVMWPKIDETKTQSTFRNRQSY